MMNLELLSCIAKKCRSNQPGSVENFGPSLVSVYIPSVFRLIMTMNNCLTSSKADIPQIDFQGAQKLQNCNKFSFEIVFFKQKFYFKKSAHLAKSEKRSKPSLQCLRQNLQFTLHHNRRMHWTKSQNISICSRY